MIGRGSRADAIRRIQRWWLRSVLALAAVGFLLAPLGFGSSRWQLFGFVVMFVAASVPAAARVLRPRVKLVDTMHGSATEADHR
jgi:uncharacterized membrane protein YedE/YeeE